jgi:ribosome-associated protein
MQRQGVLSAVRACEEKKASDITLLELEKGSSAFTDYFVICSGSNPRQMQAISDEVEQQLAKSGLRPLHVEGYNQADWILLDYVDFVVHVFSESARKFYDLERLWKSAKRVELGDLKKAVMRKTVRTAASSRRALARKPPTPARKKK